MIFFTCFHQQAPFSSHQMMPAYAILRNTGTTNADDERRNDAMLHWYFLCDVGQEFPKFSLVDPLKL